jgi:hypothetical protein
MKPPFFPILRRAKAIEWNRISNVSLRGDDERNRGNDKKKDGNRYF